MLNIYSAIPCNVIIACFYFTLQITIKVTCVISICHPGFKLSTEIFKKYTKTSLKGCSNSWNQSRFLLSNSLAFWYQRQTKGQSCHNYNHAYLTRQKSLWNCLADSTECCIFWPAFGCCALQTLVEIVIFSIFSAKRARNLQQIFAKNMFFKFTPKCWSTV